MISGTDFLLAAPGVVGEVCANLPPSIATPTEVAEIQAKCAAKQALCLVCDDAMAVVELRARAPDLELFVWITVGFRYGAFERQLAAVLAIARELGAQTVAFQSRRRGWARRLGPQWTPRNSSEFVRAVR
jgi:hypothetical protein